LKVYWQLRFRSPLALTRGVDDAQIETNSTDPARAEAVGRFWLSRNMAHPDTRFVFVRPWCVQTEDDMEAALALAAGAQAAQAHASETPPSVPAPAVVAAVTAEPKASPKARVGA